MTIADLMSKCVVECTEDASVEEVYNLLQKCEHRTVVVVDSLAHRVPIGVVNERSMCEQIIGRGRSLRSLVAGSMLDTRIITVPEKTTIDSIKLDGARELSAVVVVNDRRQPCGLVPKERLASLGHSIATTNSSGQIVVTVGPRVSPAVSEIPAFGWIQ